MTDTNDLALTLDHAVMADAVSVGRARRMFADDPIGPVLLDECWWVIPSGGRDYERCGDAQHTALDELDRRHRELLATEDN